MTFIMAVYHSCSFQNIIKSNCCGLILTPVAILQLKLASVTRTLSLFKHLVHVGMPYLLFIPILLPHVHLFCVSCNTRIKFDHAIKHACQSIGEIHQYLHQMIPPFCSREEYSPVWKLLSHVPAGGSKFL